MSVNPAQVFEEMAIYHLQC